MLYDIKLTSINIRRFVKDFEDNHFYERKNYRAALELVNAFPTNKKYGNIFIKVNFINGAFKTAIGDTLGVSKLIHTSIKDIDRRLRAEDEKLIKEISYYQSGDNSPSINYSFATKFCHCHQPALFPIYDSYVVKSLFAFNELHSFSDFDKDSLKDYKKFRKVIDDFSNCVSGQRLNNGTIDRFLWALGRKAILGPKD